MTRALFLVLTLALLSPSTAWAKKGNKGGDKGGDGRELTFKKGTMELGGYATFDLYAYGGDTTWMIDLAPTAGYFLTKKMELVGQLAVGFNGDDTHWGLDGGVRYYFDMKPNWAYLGAMGGYASTKALEVFGQGGLLIPLSKNVGLDVGAQLGIEKYADVDEVGVALSAGYLGVHGFFR